MSRNRATEGQPDRSRYRNVQGLRGLAALAVVIGHADGLSLIHVPPWLAVCGYSGVDLFFVISGFIICQTTISDRVRGGGARAGLLFLAKRYGRIYPLYWVVLAVVMTTSIWLPLQYKPIPCGQEIARYILLVVEGNNCFIPPAWTLQYELYFYTVVAALLFLVPRNFYSTLVLFMLTQAVYVALSGSAFSDNGFLSSPLILEFGAGCAISWLHQRGFQKWAVGTLLLGAVIFAFGPAQAIHTEPSPLSRVLTFGLGGALVLYALVTFEVNGKLILPRPIQKLGDASYSLYLWHWPLVTIFVKLALGWLGIAAILVVSFASYQLIETPLASLFWRALGTKIAFLSRPRMHSTKRDKCTR